MVKIWRGASSGFPFATAQAGLADGPGSRHIWPIMQHPLYPVFWAIDQILILFLIVLFVRIILSWLFVFQVVNPRHPLAWQVNRASIAITDPVMRPIQRILPPMGGLDLSPFVIIIAVYVIQMYLWQVYGALT